jgi:hypothetical protein
VSAPTGADTIGSEAVPPLVIEVRDAQGRAVPAVEVRFDAPGSEQHYVAKVFIQPIEGDYRPEPIADTTDGSGRAGVVVRRGLAAGTAWIRVTVPATALRDSVPVTILSGAGTQILFGVPDTAILVAASYSPRAVVADWFGNPRADPVVLTSDSGAVSVSGATLTGVAIGRAAIDAHVGALFAQGWTSVVPPGTLAAYRNPETTGDSVPIVVFDTDGANRRTLTAVPHPGFQDRAPFWAPDGASVVFHAGGFEARLYAVTLVGAVSRVIQTSFPASAELWPHYSRDGTWIYFTAVTAPYTGGSEIWRVRPTGGGLARVGPASGGYGSDTHASPSPDGLRLVFATDRQPPTVDPSHLAILDVAADSVSYLGVRGLTPRWAPDGQLIAFWDDGSIKVMAPDGTGQRIVSPPFHSFLGGIDWAPDSRWLAVSDGSRISLIDSETGMTLPLAFTRFYRQPTWHP